MTRYRKYLCPTYTGKKYTEKDVCQKELLTHINRSLTDHEEIHKNMPQCLNIKFQFRYK